MTVETESRRWRLGQGVIGALPIRWQLLALLLALAVPFSIYFVIAAQRQAADRRAEAGQQMLAIARVMAARIDDHVGDIAQVLSFLSAVAGPTSNDIAKNQALLRQLASRLPPQTNDIGIWNADGKNVGGLDASLRNVRVSDRAFFREAMSGTALAVEAPSTVSAADQAVGVFALRIEHDGIAVGVVAVTSKLRELQQLLMPGDRPGVSRLITVTNENGVVLARSIAPELWVGRSLVGGPGGPTGSRSGVDGIHDGPSADGVDRIAGFASATRVPWRVYVGMPVEAALAEVTSSLQANLLAASAMFVVGLALFGWMSRRLTVPLRRLEVDARRFGRGEFDHRSEVSGVAEIALLSATLNGMATALKQNDEALRNLAQEQQDVLDTDLLAMFRVKDRCVLWTNAGVEKLLGYRPDEWLGRPTRLIYPDDESYRAAGEEGYAALAAGHTFRTQLLFVRKDGGRVWADMQATSVPTRPGEALIMLVDITPLKLEEQTRQKSLALAAQNTALRESNRVKAAFLANMSHELHTPLNAVIGYAQILRRRGVATGSARDERYLEDIGHSGQQLLQLIDTMLDFAKAESNRFEIQPASVDLLALIDDVVAMAGYFDRQKNIDLLVSVDPSVHAVSTDATVLKQVVLQLLSNAIRFSHTEGRVAVTVAPEGRDDFRIDVQDHGIGIAENDLARLFVAFQQLSEGTTKNFPGAGLGLALARRLVEALHGRIEVTSTLGVGSTFSIVLPRH